MCSTVAESGSRNYVSKNRHGAQEDPIFFNISESQKVLKGLNTAMSRFRALLLIAVSVPFRISVSLRLCCCYKHNVILCFNPPTNWQTLLRMKIQNSNQYPRFRVSSLFPRYCIHKLCKAGNCRIKFYLKTNNAFYVEILFLCRSSRCPSYVVSVNQS